MSFSPRLLAFALGTGLALATPTAARAQVGYGVAGGFPAWGPPVPQGTQYYYIPEIDGYYDLYNGLYIVFDGQQWVGLPYLNGYDPYYFHPVPVVSYAGPRPWLYINSYRQRYPQYVVGYRHGGWGRGGYGGRGQGYGAGQPYGYYRNGYSNNYRGYGYGSNNGQRGYGYGQRGYGYGSNNANGQQGYNQDQRDGYNGRNQRESDQPDLNQNQNQPSQQNPATYGQRQSGRPTFGDQPTERQSGTDRDQRGEAPGWGMRRGR